MSTSVKSAPVKSAPVKSAPVKSAPVKSAPVASTMPAPKPVKIKITDILPSFAKGAADIVAAEKRVAGLKIKATAAAAAAIQKHLDACAVNGVPRDKAGADAIAKAMRECEIFTAAIDRGDLEKKTITEYAQGAARAYFHNVPWAASLKNDPAYKIPDANGSVKAGGSVTTTTADAAAKTARKLIVQLRLLQADGAAASIVDAMLEAFPDFTETDEEATV